MKPTATRARGMATSGTHTAHELAISVSNHPSIALQGPCACEFVGGIACMLPFWRRFRKRMERRETAASVFGLQNTTWVASHGPTQLREDGIKQLAIRKILNFYCAFHPFTREVSLSHMLDDTYDRVEPTPIY